MRQRFLICLLFFYLIPTNYIFAQADQLKLSTPLEREIAENETHSYQITVKTGEFVHLLVSQKKSDIFLEGFLPNQQKFASVDNSNTQEERERISFIAEADGVFRFDISRVRNFPSATGKDYEIILESQRLSTAQDKSRVTAESLYNQGNLARFKPDKDSKLNSIKLFQQSITLFREAEDKLGEGLAIYAIGQVEGQLSQYSQSQASYENAIKLFREVNDLPQLAIALDTSAAIYFRQANLPKTIEVLNEATKLYKQDGNRLGEISVLSKFGLIYSVLGQPRRAIQTFQETLPILQQLGDKAKEALTLSNMASTYDDIGEPILAVENYEKALAIRRNLGDVRSLPVTLSNMSIVYRRIGENQKFQDSVNEALRFFRESGNKEGEATCLNNLAAWYFSIGNYDKAEELHLQSLAIHRELKLAAKEAGSLGNLGDIYIKRQKPDKALEFFTQALQILQNTQDKQFTPRILTRLGIAWKEKKDFTKSVEFFNQALILTREIEDREGEAEILFYLSQISWQSGEKEKTLELLNKVLEIQSAIKDRISEATTLVFFSKAQMELGNLAEAQKTAEKALEIIENYRGKIERDDFRAAYFADKLTLYEVYLEILIRRHQAEQNKGFNALALQTSERARARNLLETLGEIKFDLSDGVANELIEQEKKLRRTINEKEFRRTQLLLWKSPPANIADLEKEIGELIEEHRQTQAKIRRTNPNFANLNEPQPLNLQQIQSEILDDKTVLLEYFVGENRSWLFFVSKTNLEIFELPKKAEIEAIVKPLLSSLREVPMRKVGETDSQLNIRLANSKKLFAQRNSDLSQILLKPIQSKIKDKRLLIVASDSLQYVPFAVLKPNQAENNYLIETNEIVNLPSASVLSNLRKVSKPKSSKDLTLFADPVFDLNDVRVKAKVAKTQTIEQNSANTPRSNLKRLEFSRFEAEAISNLFPKERKTVVLDFEANIPSAKSAEISQSRFVHFASHGLVNSETPELSGIVLSLVNEKGIEQDGFLRLNEIYNLRLSADLVVLSACETALGEEIKGEGIIGLTRGFMYAGASSVVSSLWAVDDRATYQLMQRFYQAMLKDNLPPSAALRKAQISLLSEKGFETPFYWSAFTIQGEFR